MIEVVLKIRMPDNWVANVTHEFDTSLRFIDCMPYGESGGRGLVEIKGTREEVARIVEEIKRHPDISHVEISPLREGVLGSIVTNKCVACRILTGSDCFLTSALSLGDGNVEWRLIAGKEGSFRELLEKLKASGCEVELKKIIHLNKKSTLTKRQEEVMRVAFEKGYYNYPKKITVRKLAEIFDVHPSTLNEIIQRGERKIVWEHLRSK